MTTIGGGVVIDPSPDKHRRSDAATVRRLERLEGADDAARVRLWVEEAGATGVPSDALAARLGLDTATLSALVDEVVASAAVAAVGRPALLVASSALESLQREIVGAIDRYHDERPLRPAMPKSELRERVAAGVPAAVLDHLLERLADDDTIRIEPAGLALPDHRVRLSGEQHALCDELLSTYREAGLSPPGADEIAEATGARGDEVERLLHHLLREGDLVRIRDGMVVAADAIDDLLQGLAEQWPPGTDFSVADFKEWTGTTRKHAIPILEYLDQERVTRRVGDRRETL